MKEHKISLFSAILLNMNIMIGSGILIGAGQSAAIAGNASFLGWLLVFCCFLPLVLCVIQLGNLFPQATGIYQYASNVMGPLAGFISAWFYITGYTFTCVVETLALRTTLANATNNFWLFQSPALFNALVVGICVALSLASWKLVSRFLNSLTLVKLLPLIILIALIPFIFNPSFSVTGAELKALPFSLPFLIFGFFGFEYCTSFSHLIQDSEKNAPRAILLGFLATAIIYMLFHFGLLNLMGAENLAIYQASSFADYITLPLPYLKTLLKLLIPAASAITIFAVALGCLNSNATLLHALASQKQLAGGSLLTKLNAQNRPWVTLLIQGLVVFAIATIIPSMKLAGALCIFSVFCSFVLPVFSLILISKQRNMKKKLPIAVLGFITVLGFVAYSWYTLSPTFDMSERMLYSAIAAIILAIGIVLHRLAK